MKRTLLFLPALLLAVMFLLPAQARAEERSVFIRVESAEAAAGDETDLAVTLEGCAGVDSVQFDLNYDPAALQVVSMTPGDLFPAEYTVANLSEPGRVRIACASALGIGDAGRLLILRFRALTDAGSAVTISSGIVTRVDAEYNQSTAYVVIENGGVSIGGAPLPAAAVTPWIPETPAPTPTPVPTPSPTPSPTPTPAEMSTLPQDDAAPAEQKSIPTMAYFVAGGLALVIIVMIIAIAAAKKRRRG